VYVCVCVCVCVFFFLRPSVDFIVMCSRAETAVTCDRDWCCFQLEPGVPLPSPNQLRRKILIKNKRLIPEDEKCKCSLADLFYV